MGLVGSKDVEVAVRGLFGLVEKFRMLERGKVGTILHVGVSEPEKDIPREGCHVWSLRGGVNVIPCEGCHVRCVFEEGRKLGIDQYLVLDSFQYRRT